MLHTSSNSHSFLLTQATNSNTYLTPSKINTKPPFCAGHMASHGLHAEDFQVCFASDQCLEMELKDECQMICRSEENAHYSCTKELLQIPDELKATAESFKVFSHCLIKMISRTTASPALLICCQRPCLNVRQLGKTREGDLPLTKAFCAHPHLSTIRIT